MSKKSKTIDNKNLFQELQSAIEADKMYWVQNDAKLRAVVSAKTYDEFRDTVAAAHLDPLTKKDITKKFHTWNAAARNTSTK